MVNAATKLENNINPMGTDGFEFVEYATKEPEKMDAMFKQLGFTAVAKHRSKNVTLYRQGDINFILNAEPGSQAEVFSDVHGPSVNAMAFRVKDSAYAAKRAVELGAELVASKVGPMELNIPAIKGIGESLIYLVDRYNEQDIYGVDFVPIKGADQKPKGFGLKVIDHLTHNVYRGNMEKWAGFYEKLFNFREIRYFDIEGKLTGLVSKAMTSPCGKIRIPINESSDDKSQIEEYLAAYNGEGIQHIALSTETIYDTVEGMRKNNVTFLDVPDTYYAKLDKRLPNHGEDVARLQKNKILLDGHYEGGANMLLLQIFTATMVGPVFFEIIQRKGDEGFGEGNFKALFESMEEDQVRRGVLKDTTKD